MIGTLTNVISICISNSEISLRHYQSIDAILLLCNEIKKNTSNPIWLDLKLVKQNMRFDLSVKTLKSLQLLTFYDCMCTYQEMETVFR